MLLATVDKHRSTMKLLKRTFIIFLILLTFGLLFRGWFYRHLVTYKSIGLRNYHSVTEKKLTNYIEANIDEQSDPDIEQIVKLGLSITSSQLNFTANNNNNFFSSL